jgi:hypothetical protein
VIEDVRIDVCRAPDGPCRGLCDDLAPTLAGRIVAAFEEYRRFLRDRLPARTVEPLMRVTFTNLPVREPAAMYEAFASLREAVRELDRRQPLPVRGRPGVALDAVTLAQPPVDVDPDAYDEQARPALRHMVAALVQSFVDRVSGLQLPPCPPEPTDGRVVLACVTVADGEVLQVCNACRHHAGSAPGLDYRLSVVPLAATLGAVTEWVLCRPWVSTDGTGNPVFELLDRVDRGAGRRSSWYRSGFQPIPQIAGLIEILCATQRADSDPGRWVRDSGGTEDVLRAIFGGTS